MLKTSKGRFLSLVLAVCFCALSAVTAYAVTPYDINKIRPTCELTSQNGKAVMYSKVTAEDNVTKMEMTQVLQKKNEGSYTDVPNATSDTKIFGTNYGTMETTVSFTGAGTYRVKLICVVKSSYGTDTHYVYSDPVTIK